MDRLARYEELKARWIRDNPKASPSEYESAMRYFAKKCGV